MTRDKHPTGQRLSRDEWIEKALEIVINEGSDVLTINQLVQKLGVSRGSFYWHFKNMDDFIRQLIAYWLGALTKRVSIETTLSTESAEESLISLATHIVSDRLSRYDIALRAWATHNPLVMQGVKKADNFRLNHVRFEGDELEMRARTFVVYYSSEGSQLVSLSRKQKLRHIKLRHALLMKP
jgi:AcrR family transcriptional regulator